MTEDIGLSNPLLGVPFANVGDVKGAGLVGVRWYEASGYYESSLLYVLCWKIKALY